MLYKLILNEEIEDEMIINLNDIRKLENINYFTHLTVTYINGDVEDIQFKNATLKSTQVEKMLKMQ